ncbi:MAG: hypothetical protein NT075_09735 [Chloroflexi bacterium]|nr:hypothetical protein [Chloroflexota bacterium]
MKWFRNDQPEINKNHTSDNQCYGRNKSMFDEDDDQQEERLSPNLSMEEVRTLLDEFEEILHTK